MLKSLSPFGRTRIGSSTPTGPDITPILALNPRFWMEADLGLYNATSGGTLVTTDGTAVKRWEDQKNTNHATNASNNPILKTSIVNGKNILRFTPNQYLSGPDIPQLDGVATFTIFMVGKRSAANSFVILGKRSNTSVGTFFGFWSDGNFYAIIATAANAYANFATNDTSFHQVNIIFDGSQSTNATKLKVRMDRVDKTLTFGGAGIGTVTGDSGTFEIGRDPAFSNYSTGDIAQVALFDGALNSTDRDTVETYLNTKYGV